MGFYRADQKKDFVQGDMFSSLLPKLNEDSPLFSKEYKEQQELIDKPIDYVSRKAIELQPLDFLIFFLIFKIFHRMNLRKSKYWMLIGP